MTAAASTPNGSRASRDGLSARLAEARKAARALHSNSADLLVAARITMTKSVELIAHALPDIGQMAGTHALTLCDLLAGDEVVLVPDLRWDSVATTSRCPECLAVAASPAWS